MREKGDVGGPLDHLLARNTNSMTFLENPLQALLYRLNFGVRVEFVSDFECPNSFPGSWPRFTSENQMRRPRRVLKLPSGHTLPHPIAFLVAPLRLRLALFWRLQSAAIVFGIPADGVKEVFTIVS